MTDTHILSGSRQEPASVSPPRLHTTPLAKIAAEKACAAFFAQTASIGSLQANDRQAVASAVVQVLSVDDGRPIRSQSAAYLHLLVEGWAVRAQTLANGARLITDVVLPGDLCNWSPLKIHEAGQDIRAAGPARVAVLRKDAVARSSSTLSRSWEWIRDAEAQTLRFRLVSLGRRDARERVAYLLSELHHRLDRVGLTNSGIFDCPLTQEQIADVLGLHSVHVNRVLQGLRSEGFIMFKRPRVTILDLARLHLLAGFNGELYDVDLGD